MKMLAKLFNQSSITYFETKHNLS